MSDMYVTADTGHGSKDTVTDISHVQPDAHIQMYPMRHCKIVHFIRHGEGYHNVAGRKSTEEYKKEDYADAHLTELGWTQAHALQQHISQLPEPLNVEAVIVSPLSRALQTAVGAFGGTSNTEGTAQPLMIKQEHILEKQFGHTAVTSAGTPPFICWEWCREHLGLHPCDRRSSLTYLKQNYPAVDFSLIEEEEDVYWQRDSRESHEQIRERGRKFVRWLMARPERRLAVVSHSSFMYFLLSNYGHGASETVQSEIRRWYENCEMRTVILTDTSGESGGLDPLFFPGGHSMKGSTGGKGPAT